MKKVALLLAYAALVPTSSRATEAPPLFTLEHAAPLACTVMCAYWDAPGAAGYNECSRPFPDGSYDQTLLRLTSRQGVVRFEMRSEIDYDSFICTNTEPPVLVPAFLDPIGDNCSGITGRGDPIAVGCLERLDLHHSALVAANGGVNEMEFIVISYNWSDTGSLPVNVWGPVEVIDDSFEASIM